MSEQELWDLFITRYFTVYDLQLQGRERLHHTIDSFLHFRLKENRKLPRWELLPKETVLELVKIDSRFAAIQLVYF